MSKQTGCCRIGLSAAEGRIIVQGLSAAALYLRRKCQQEPENPAVTTLTNQAQELEETAARLDGIGDVDCQVAVSIEATTEADVEKLLSVTPAGWAIASTGLNLLSENCEQTSPVLDHTLHALANKVTALAGWTDSFLCTIHDEKTKQDRGKI